MNIFAKAISIAALVGVPSSVLLAQPQIGPVICNTSNLIGTYEISINGQQVTSAGKVSKLLDSKGTVTLDGQSNVSFALTANIVNGLQSFGAPIVYSGTYSVRANCTGTINVTTGASITFAITAYAVNTSTGRANAFHLSGSDSTYAYTGTANGQPAACSVSTLHGPYPFTSTGFSLSAGNFTGDIAILGIFQPDGQGNLTASWTTTTTGSSTPVTATGTYTVTAGCVGTGTLVDSANNRYTLSLSLYGNADFVFSAATPQAEFSGSALHQISFGAVTCSAATLNGVYEYDQLGKSITAAGINNRFFSGVGTATFDGVSKVVLSLTENIVDGSQNFGVAAVYAGTYTVKPDCTGTIAVNFAINSGGVASFVMNVYALSATTTQERAFTLQGGDSNYVYTGKGNINPDFCATSTLSGSTVFIATGNQLSGATDAGRIDIDGLLSFDGQGKVTGTWRNASNVAGATISTTNASGTYSLTPACTGSATLIDGLGNKYSFQLSAFGSGAENVELAVSSPKLMVLGTAAAFSGNPETAVVNAASSQADATPPGSIFTIYGTGFANQQAGATSVPLPTTLQTTSVTVNGELAPLFYADANQINAQMPLDIPPGIATVIVKNGNAVSNAVAVTVPSTGTPGLFIYGSNRAVVINPNGSVNSAAAPAKAGQVLVAYFTGGGPVQGAKLTSGTPTPGALYPLTGTSSVTVGGKAAVVSYIGLTPGSIGLYQVNFVVPATVAAGDRQLVINVAGYGSNGALVAISN
jgi:uncharacterized protein (TIGR03437 family)